MANRTLVIKNGKDLFYAMAEEQDLGPFSARPSSVFFLVHAQAFADAWKMWIYYALDHRQYNVSSPSFIYVQGC